jgi:mannose-1-phosphate guanylyltransferase
MLDKDRIFVYIMAGGEGNRFAPLSTPEKPKQFLDVINGKSLLAQTYERMRKLTRNIFIGTNVKYVNLVHKSLKVFESARLIIETEKKNTAPAIAHAAKVIQAINKDAILVCVPADHYIQDEEKFRENILRAVEVAIKYQFVLTLGMKPMFASVDYGYQRVDVHFSSGVWRVSTFIEKPKFEAARRYVADEKYYWNSGVFVWHIETLMRLYRKYAPQIYNLTYLISGGDTTKVAEYYSKVPNISVDYAIMEKAQDIATIPTDVGWSDVGNWDGLQRLIETNKDVKISNDFMEYLNKRRM